MSLERLGLEIFCIFALFSFHLDEHGYAWGGDSICVSLALVGVSLERLEMSLLVTSWADLAAEVGKC